MTLARVLVGRQHIPTDSIGSMAPVQPDDPRRHARMLECQWFLMGSHV